jgi:chlorite dismutase
MLVRSSFNLIYNHDKLVKFERLTKKITYGESSKIIVADGSLFVARLNLDLGTLFTSINF